MPKKEIGLGQFWHIFEFSHLRLKYCNYVWILTEELQLFCDIFK